MAHPEDEFCTPGEDGLDPELCRALNELDSQSPAVGESPALSFEMQRGFAETFNLYVKIGVQHILPGGADHILFVLALVLTLQPWRRLLLQISAFTVAHTLTLALAATGVITPQAAIVEPIIALTIAFVAVENLVFANSPRWRPLVVFVFGLIHGLGFAGFFGELGLPKGQFLSALLGFNVGVEVGQLGVMLVTLITGLALRRWVLGSARYRKVVVLPVSLSIAVVGLWWTFQRIAG